MAEATRGNIKVRYDNRVLDVAPKDLRPHLANFVFLMAACLFNHVDRAFSVIRNAVSGLTENRIVLLGHVCQTSKWLVTTETSRYASVWSAIRHLASQLPEIVKLIAARIGRKVPVLPGMSEYRASLLITWPHSHPDNTHTHWIEPTSTFNFRQSYGEVWEQYHWVQLLCSEHPYTAATDSSRRELPAGNPGQANDSEGIRVGQPLQSIPEEVSEDFSDDVSFMVYDQQDPELVSAGIEALKNLMHDIGSVKQVGLDDEDSIEKHFVVVSDAVLKKTVDTSHAFRGKLILR